jgi:hypothetical protein
MASDESNASWAGVIEQLVTSFNLLRDVFGYALPGAVFLGIGLVSGGLQRWLPGGQHPSELLKNYPMPAWAALIAAIALCYAVGHILATIAYLRIDLWKAWLAWRANRPKGEQAREQLEDYPTEVNADEEYWQMRFPGLFNRAERRETMALLSFSLAAALLLGWLVFCELHASLRWTIFGAGVLVLLDTLTSMNHLKRVRNAAIAAAERAAKDPHLKK